MFLLLPMLILAACAVALRDWRKGVFAAVVVGLVQDPLRKLIPGAPGYYAMSTVPVWMTLFGAALASGAVRPAFFIFRFPRLGRALKIFGAYLIVPAMLSASYGRNTWQVTALGALVYATTFGVLCCGWRYPMNPADVRRALAFYVLAASAALLGGPLDRLGWSARYAAVGTEALGHVWVTHRTGEAVYMLAGFFRSPDVMGWHAALALMGALVLAARARGAARWGWIAAAAWGFVNIWLCGRRKMISMIPIFLGVYLVEVAWFQGLRRWALAGAASVLAVGLGFYIVTHHLRDDPVQRFYLTAFDEAEEQVWRHGVAAVWGTLEQAGFWGYGLGMGQQGVHHIRAEMPNTWQESGPTKLVAELGVPGALLFCSLLILMALTAYHVLRRIAASEEFPVGAGIVAILAANLSAGIVSAQVYGDPFIALLLALLAGLFFSFAEWIPSAGSETPCPASR